ncbi:MAG: hypothetical protein PHI68_08340, partial [Candidatus Cloacimonetes bacterium]|nr:hypothetical protein [Candidatus Cloacimonadota bacterium]
MIKVFIDSNVYLALYSSVTNQVSLEMIRHLSESGNLIVTKQNVDEVIRNRYKLASELLSEKTVMPESKYP